MTDKEQADRHRMYLIDYLENYGTRWEKVWLPLIKLVHRRCTKNQPAGVWAAYSTGYSEIVMFSNEIEALRYGREHRMSVDFMPFGVGLRTRP